MELLNILLSSLLGVLSPVGWVLDATLEGEIRDRFEEIEQLQVRIDNVPSHQILAGKVDGVRIAGRGLLLPPLIDGVGEGEMRSLRIAVLDVETDPIDLDLDRLDDGIEALEKPLQAGIRLVLEEADLDRFFSASDASGEGPSFEIGELILTSPEIDFTDENRLQVRFGVQEKDDREPLEVAIESGFRVLRGRYLELVEPRAIANGEEAAPQLLASILGEAGQIDLDRLSPPGVMIRVLRWHLTPDRFEIAVFVRVSRGSPQNP